MRTLASLRAAQSMSVSIVRSASLRPTIRTSLREAEFGKNRGTLIGIDSEWTDAYGFLGRKQKYYPESRI
jgi:hypothetical protein